jgi:hypothetical protein
MKTKTKNHTETASHIPLLSSVHFQNEPKMHGYIFVSELLGSIPIRPAGLLAQAEIQKKHFRLRKFNSIRIAGGGVEPHVKHGLSVSWIIRKCCGVNRSNPLYERGAEHCETGCVGMAMMCVLYVNGSSDICVGSA